MKSLLFALCLAVPFAGCDDGNNNNDSGLVILDTPPVDRPAADAANDAAPQDTPAPTDAPTPTDVTADASADVTADVSADASADAPADVSRGMYVDGCFVGTPVEMTDFLNRCTTATSLPPRGARGTRLAPDGGVQPLAM